MVAVRNRPQRQHPNRHSSPAGTSITTEAERRKSVEIAIADSRIEGMPPPDGAELEILEAFIRGEIKAEDLVDVYKQRQHERR